MPTPLTWKQRLRFGVFGLMAGLGIVMLSNAVGSLYIEMNIRPEMEPTLREYTEGLLVGLLAYLVLLIWPVFHISKVTLSASLGQSLTRIFIAAVVCISGIDLMMGILTGESTIIPWRLSLFFLMLAAALIMYQFLVIREQNKDSVDAYAASLQKTMGQQEAERRSRR